MVAARIIAGIENPSDVLVVASRLFGQRPILKFSTYTGSRAATSRWTPGTLTNQITKKYLEPRLVIVTDPRVDYLAIREASYANIPTIALCDTDSPLEYVDVAIPCNTKNMHSIALIYWMLAREIQYLRGGLDRAQDWEVMMDLFVHKELEDVKNREEEAADADEEEEEEEEPVEETEEVGQYIYIYIYIYIGEESRRS